MRVHVYNVSIHQSIKKERQIKVSIMSETSEGCDQLQLLHAGCNPTALLRRLLPLIVNTFKQYMYLLISLDCTVVLQEEVKTLEP